MELKEISFFDKERLHKVLFERHTPIGRLFETTLLIAIIASIILVTLESVKGFSGRCALLFDLLEWTFTILFTIFFFIFFFFIIFFCVSYFLYKLTTSITLCPSRAKTYAVHLSRHQSQANRDQSQRCPAPGAGCPGWPRLCFITCKA